MYETVKRALSLCLTLLLVLSLGVGCSPPEEPDYEILKMAAWAEIPEVARIVAEYNATHDDSQIEVTYFYDLNVLNFESAMQRARAELVSSTEYDVYALNGLDRFAMTQAGVLADLYPYIEADETFSEEDYYWNIQELYVWEGGLYEFVPSFWLSGFTCPASVAGLDNGWTIEEFYAALQTLDEDDQVLGDSRGMLVSQMVMHGGVTSYVDLEARTCDFETESFYEWLDFVRDVPLTDNSFAVMEDMNFFGLTHYLQEVYRYGETLVIKGMPSDAATGACVSAYNTFAISAYTDQPELSWEFIKFLLEDKPQEIMDGFSIRRDLTEDILSRISLPIDDPNYYYYGQTMGENNEPIPPLPEETADYLRNLLETISCRWFTNRDIMDVIIEEVTIYLEETEAPIPAEQIAARIQDRVSLCLAELDDGE